MPKGLRYCFGIAEKFPELQVFDFGGGFKVPYKPGEEGTDIALLGKKSGGRKWNGLKKKYDRHMQVWFEPGKFLVSEAGYFITKVKCHQGIGRHQFCGGRYRSQSFYQAMFYGSYHIIDNISNPGGAQKMYNVVGNICETDTFAEDRLLNEVREGDYLVFKNAGAYGFEMASNYNSRFKPAEVLVKDGKAQLVRKRDNMEDLLHNIVELQ